MKNITLSADDHLIEVARERARAKKTTLNAEFRRWLEQYTNTEKEAKQRLLGFHKLMADLSHVTTGGQKFNRDEMNER